MREKPLQPGIQATPPPLSEDPRIILPSIPNYTLSSECPACGNTTVRHACKVRCERCGFMWDCSEL